MTPLLARATIALNKVQSLALEEDPHAAATEDESFGSNWRTIELKGVTHGYADQGDEHPFSLGPINLTLAAGECVFLIGGNGGGKSTLAKIIAGLYEPEQGAIVLDGRVIEPKHRPAYRQMFSGDFFRFLSIRPVPGAGRRATRLNERGSISWIYSSSTRFALKIIASRPRNYRPASGNGSRCWSVISRIGRSTYLMNGPRIRIPFSKKFFTRKFLAISNKGAKPYSLSHTMTATFI